MFEVTAEEKRLYKIKNLTPPSDKMLDELNQKNLVSIDEEDLEIKSGKWAIRKGIIFYECEDTVNKLPPGVYNAHMTMQGPILEKADVKTDDLIALPDESSEKVLKHIEEFWTRREDFKRLGYLHKRGVLLWGPPGGGKTSTVMQTIKQIVDVGGISVICNSPGAAKSCLQMIRRVESERPIVAVIEDVDELVCMYGDRTLTELLDGESNIDNILYLATTNYPERLPKRLINRPSRFDIVMKIGLPNDAARRIYLEHKAPTLSPSDLTVWVKKTKGLTLSHIKELIVSVLIYKISLDDAINRLDSMFTQPNSANDFKE